MFRNYLTAALRNLARNRLFTAINVLGLTVGFAAALLIALFVRDEYSYDRWIPGHESVYALTMLMTAPSDVSKPFPTNGSDNGFAAKLKLDFPEIRQIARIGGGGPSTLRNGGIEGPDGPTWADPDFFRLFPLPVVAGDLSTALDQADSIVLTRKLARKYFGRDDPVGETIEMDRTYPMRVTAVIEDLPSNTHLYAMAIASSRTSFSSLAQYDARMVNAPRNGNINANTRTYLRLAPGASVEEVIRRFPEFVERHKSMGPNRTLSLGAVPVADVHLMPGNADPRKTIAAFVTVGALIVVLAAINFINLMTARATRRAVEIGVRKVSGADRRHLIIQFIGEAALYVALSMALALVLAHFLMPMLNVALGRTMASPLLQAPVFFAGLLATAMAAAILAGFYPAMVLSAFRPAVVLKRGKADAVGNALLRQTLVVLQFAVLIGLSLVAGITYRQTEFALKQSLRLDTDQVLTLSNRRISLSLPPTQVCRTVFTEAIAALPGVVGLQCSSTCAVALNCGTGSGGRRTGSEETFSLLYESIDYGFFAFFGVRPIAGRLFEAERNDMEPGRNPDATQLPAVVNETAVRKYGFASAQEAIGQVVEAGSGTKANFAEIIGVVPDFKSSVYEVESPTAYFAVPSRFERLHVRLKGDQIPETVEALDRLWAQLGDSLPTPRRFVDENLQAVYGDIAQRARLLVVFAVIAAFIAVLGMFGLSTFIAERRTKEIGIRKSMGATRGDILRLLVWEFCKPVLVANLLAWPAAYFFMQRWLEGFVRHIDLEPWMFVAASLAALVIAVLTVSGHALLVARATPVTALRYE